MMGIIKQTGEFSVSTIPERIYNRRINKDTKLIVNAVETISKQVITQPEKGN